MCGVKANSGVRMKNTRLWNPPISQFSHPRPRQVVLLAPMDQHGPPEPNHPIAECGQTVGVARYRVVVEVALHDRLEPFPVCATGSCMRLRSCCLISSQLGPHPLADRFALHRKVPVPVLPADMRESQKIERLGLPFSSLVPVCSANRPNSIRRVLSGCSSSPNFPSRSRNSSRKRSASARCWNPSTLSSAYRTTTTSPRAHFLRQTSTHRSNT